MPIALASRMHTAFTLSIPLAAQQAIYAQDAYRSSDHDPVNVGLDLQAVPSLDLIFSDGFELD